MPNPYHLYEQDKDTQRWWKPKNKRPELSEWIWMIYDEEEGIHMGMYRIFPRSFDDDQPRWGIYVDGTWITDFGAPRLWTYVSVPPLSIEGEKK